MVGLGRLITGIIFCVTIQKEQFMIYGLVTIPSEPMKRIFILEGFRRNGSKRVAGTKNVLFIS